MMAGRGVEFSAAGGPARHIPVMLSEVLSALEPKDGKIFIDGTFGACGYSRGLLEAARCSVLAIDRDPRAKVFARMLEEEGESVAEKKLTARGLADWAPALRSGRRGVVLSGHASTRAILVWCPGEEPPADGTWTLCGDIAVSVTSADGAATARLRDGAVELVRAGREGSPWDGLSGADARAAFLEALADPYWGVRWRAVRNLARTGPLDEPSRVAIRRLLADDHGAVRLAAARALHVGPPSRAR